MYKICCKKNITINIKNADLLFKVQKSTKNIGSKKVTMTNKVIRDQSRCANCMVDKSRFLKQKHNKQKWSE